MEPLERLRLEWENKFKMDLKGIRLKVVEWVPLTRDADHWWAAVNTVMRRRQWP